MTDLTALKELLERVERAEGPDREMDADIDVALFGGETIWKQANYTMEQYPASRRPAKNYVGGFANEHVPLVTSSIDACVALIEKVLPDWTAWELLSRGGKTRFFVQISKLGPDDEEIYADGRGPTPPIALLGALLSALIAKEEGGV